MRLDQLYNKHVGEDIWVVGTGPSMRVFPLSVLAGRITIGLNQAWRYCDLTYSLTVHPELCVDYVNAKSKTKTQWIVKQKGVLSHLDFDDPSYYVFVTSDNMSHVRTPVPDTLYLAHGIHCSALVLAARMGAKNIFLVGCDAATLGAEHHGHDQHVRYLGEQPETVFAAYRKDAAKVRVVLRESGVNVFTVSPFIGINAAEEDYARLCLEHGLKKLPKPKDISYVPKPSKDSSRRGAEKGLKKRNKR